MDSRLILLITVAILFMSPKFGDSNRWKLSMARYHRDYTHEEHYSFECVCNGQNRSAELDKDTMNKIFETVMQRNFCKEDETHYCGWLTECQTCRGVIFRCAPPSPEGAYDCIREKFGIPELDNNRIAKNDGTSVGLRRKTRQTSACFHPPLLTSDLFFLEYPKSISVKQKCLFGYTLDEGITREMKCLYAENEWKPTGFEECRPFIDCSLDLISGGYLECLTATPEKAPQCNITCLHYEDKPAQPKRSYECQIDGGWKPKLPFCVTNRGVIDLAPAPKIRSHPKKQQIQEEKRSMKKPPQTHRIKQKVSSSKV